MENSSSTILLYRASVYAQWELPLEQALRQEGVRGTQLVFAEGEGRATRFAQGAGRHGSFSS